MNIVGHIMIGMSEPLLVCKIYTSGSIGNREHRVFHSSMFLGGVFAQLRVFSRTALCNSVETHAAYIFPLVCFQINLRFLPAHVCFYSNLIQSSAEKNSKKCNFTDFEF